MALIEVNYQSLRNLAQSIDDYCRLQDQEMANADNRVKSVLGVSWQGEDAAAFSQKWSGVDSNNSTAVKFRNSLVGYADALRCCAQVYQSAHEEIINLSYFLPRW